MAKLTINLVAWNGEKYIPYLFDSLKKQTFKDFKLQILDNASKDKTVEAIERELAGTTFEYTVQKNEKNLGFSGGHNLLYKQVETDYVLLLNQDMYLMPECIEKAVAFLDANDGVGAVTPRLMKWNFSVIGVKGLEGSFTTTPDSLGLQVFKNRRVSDVTEMKDQTVSKEVFGVSGALPFFRMAALKDVEYEDGNLFDSLYHSYKEDVDLAFRLRGMNWRSFLVGSAVAYHDRSASGPKDQKHLTLVANNKRQSEWAKYHSYKNHLMTLYKNEYRENFLVDFLFILWYELRKFVYYLLFDPKVLAGWKEIFANINELNKKRARISREKKIKWFEFRKWIN